MGKTFSTGLLTDGISQDSSNNIGIGGATSGTNKFEVSGSTKLNGNTAITGSLSITGSATTIGNTTISGSLTVSSSANAIILPAGQTIGLGTAQIYTGTGGNSGNIFVQGAQTKLYADKVILEAATAAGVEVIGATKLSGSFIVSGSATTIGATTLSGSLNVSGSITSTSTITAQTLVVQTITSSVLYSSGSNIFGNSLSNTQQMTGSVGITGSLTLNNIAIPTSASLASTYLPLTGGTLTGALSGTSATFSGAINSSASAVFNGTGRGISYQYCDMTNTSGRLILGLEGSTAGNAFPNSEAYSVNIGTDQNQAFGVFTNNLRRLTIASTGAATFSSSVSVKSPSTSSNSFTANYSNNNQMLQLFEFASGVDVELNLRNSGGTAINRLSTNGNSFINGGNVGIGTTSPAYKFVVSNGGAAGMEFDPVTGTGGGVDIISYNRSTAAYKPITMVASSYTFNTGAATFSSSVTANRMSLSSYTGLYGKTVVKGDNISSLAFDLSTLFPEMSATFAGNVVGCFGMYTIFRSGAAETGMFSISRNSSSTWSSAAFSVQTATGTYSLGGVTGSGITITMAFNTSVYVIVEVTAMIE